jgi:hypothetical protein
MARKQSDYLAALLSDDDAPSLPRRRNPQPNALAAPRCWAAKAPSPAWPAAKCGR